MNVITSGRTDIANYFEMSGIREWTQLKHTPVLVFLSSGDEVEVRIVENPKDLLAFPDETKAMGQWRGDWRSDFFQFTIGQLRQHIADHPNPGHYVI